MTFEEKLAKLDALLVELGLTIGSDDFGGPFVYETHGPREVQGVRPAK